MRAIGGRPSREIIAMLVDRGARLSTKDKAGTC
jgi:hypothetical protein